MAVVSGAVVVGLQRIPVTADLTLPAPSVPVDPAYGVPLGTQLTVVQGGLQLGTGAVRDALDVRGPFRSTANALPVPIVTRSLINGTGSDDAVYFGGYSLDQCTIDGGADGLKANSYATITRCLIYKMDSGGGNHNDGVQITNGSHVQIIDTMIINTNSQTSCILIGSDQGPIDDVLIRGGFMEIAWTSQSGYCIYPGDSRCTNIRIEGVTFSTKYGRGRALYPSRPKTGHLIGCKYDDGTPIPDETWG